MRIVRQFVPILTRCPNSEVVRGGERWSFSLPHSPIEPRIDLGTMYEIIQTQCNVPLMPRYSRSKLQLRALCLVVIQASIIRISMLCAKFQQRNSIHQVLTTQAGYLVRATVQMSVALEDTVLYIKCFIQVFQIYAQTTHL